MAAVGVGTKYDLAINGVGYRFRGRAYSKKDAKTFAPRFGTGEMGESDLDAYKVISQSDFTGGSFQELLDDMSKYAGIADAIPNPFDKLLHPTPASTQKAMVNGTLDSYPVWAVYRGVLYKSANYYDAGVKGGVNAYYDGAWHTCAFPTGKPGVTSLAVLNDKLWACTDSGSYYSFDGNPSWTEHNAIHTKLNASFNGKMYLTGYTAGSTLGYMTTHSGTVGDNAATMVGAVGDIYQPINSFCVFNHRLYIGKADGLFAYDGVQISCIIDYSKSAHTDNFRFLSELNGSLYWITRNVLYRFNGSTVEKVEDFTNLQTICNMTSGYGRLWITTWGGSSYFTSGGKDTIIPANGYLLYCYDGLGTFLYDDTKYGSYTPYCVAIVGTSLFYFVSGASGIADSTSYLIELANEFKAGTMNDAVITTSQMDCGFPNIDKFFNMFELDYENIIVGDTITVKFRTYDGKTYSAWQTLGTFTSTSSSNRLYLYDTAYNGTFKKIQFEVTVDRAATSNLAIRGYSYKYMLAPIYKREWQITLLCVGQSDVPNELVDGSTETKTARALRENIYAGRASNAPIGFEDIDFTQLNGAINNSVTTITLDDTTTLPTSGFVKIDDEIISYTGKTATQLTGCVRGALSTTPASHTDNTIANLYYRVFLSDIVNEDIIAPSLDSFGTESEMTVRLLEA